MNAMILFSSCNIGLNCNGEEFFETNKVIDKPQGQNMVLDAYNEVRISHKPPKVQRLKYKLKTEVMLQAKAPF